MSWHSRKNAPAASRAMLAEMSKFVRLGLRRRWRRQEPPSEPLRTRAPPTPLCLLDPRCSVVLDNDHAGTRGLEFGVRNSEKLLAGANSVVRIADGAAGPLGPRLQMDVAAGHPKKTAHAHDGPLAAQRSIGKRGHAAKNRTGALARPLIDQWLARAAVNLDALNLGEMDQTLLDADYHRAACNRFAPARFHVSEHDRALRSKLDHRSGPDIVHELDADDLAFHLLDHGDRPLSLSRRRHARERWRGRGKHDATREHRAAWP